MPVGRNAVDTETGSMEALFGGMPDAARFVIAFLLVLALIGVGAFLWRRFGAGPLGTSGPRGRQPRLAVIDAANVDGRRRLVLIRRDNTEHLLMIGGPTDIVIEPNILRAGNGSAVRDHRAGPELPPRQPAETPSWQPALEPPPRVLRPIEPVEPAYPEPVVRPPPLFAERLDRLERVEPDIVAPPLSAMPPDPPLRLPEPPLHPPPVEPPPPPAYEPVFQTAPEPPPVAAAPVHEPVFQSPITAEPRRPPPPRPSQADENNLVEMAQRLEAALRRPTRPIEPAPPPPPPAEPALAARVEPIANSRVAAYFETPMPSASAPPIRPVTRDEPADTGKSLQAIAPPAVPASPPPTPAPSPKPAPTYASLEEEMASLLGRGPGKT